MKRVILLVLVAGGAIAGWRWLTDRRAYKAYEGFADAWAHEDRLAAAKFADERIVKYAFERRALRGTKGGTAMEAFRGTLYAVESRTRADNGDLELVVRQTILFDPPGVTTGIGGAMFARFRHAATVCRTSEAWRVVAFEPTFLEMGELRRRPPS